MNQTYQIPDYISQDVQNKGDKKPNAVQGIKTGVVIFLFVLTILGFICDICQSAILKIFFDFWSELLIDVPKDIPQEEWMLVFVLASFFGGSLIIVKNVLLVVNVVWLIIIGINIILSLIFLIKASKNLRIFLAVVIVISTLIIMFGPINNIIELNRLFRRLLPQMY